MYEEKVASWLISDYYKLQSTNQDTNEPSDTTSFESNYYQLLKNKSSHTKVSRFDRYTLNTITSDFRIVIPPYSPSQFSSDLIKVNWFLKFKFYLIEGKLTDERRQVLSTSNLMEKQDEFKVKPMTWFLPVSVFVPSGFRPLHEQSHIKEQCVAVL